MGSVATWKSAQASGQRSVLDGLNVDHTWQPVMPPPLRDVKKVYFNFETSGLKWWEKDRPIGGALVLPDGTSYYMPWGHRTGGNLDEDTCRRYVQTEFKGVQIVNANVKFEVHHGREWGVDFEEMGCTVTDVQHHAALLDDHRRRVALDVLIKDVLHEEPMRRVDESHMVDFHPSEVQARARYGVESVRRLEAAFAPQLEAEDLLRVKNLEDEVIYAVCEMEKNALPMDLALLEEWHTEAEQRYMRYLWQIHRETGVRFNPGSAASWEELFKKLGIELGARTANGGLVTTDNYIKRIDHPTVQLARKAGKLQDLKSDYIDKYHKTVTEDGGPQHLLRFALHQLKADDGGTVTGRFSSSGIKIGSKKIGANIQQVSDIHKQVEKGHDPDFLIRRLFIAGQGQFLSADAKQIEYRLFASYAENPKVLAAYAKDPNLSFHKLIHGMMTQHVEIIYEQQKNVNFMKIYAGGLAKMAFMLDIISEQQLEQLNREYPKGVPRDHPWLTKAREINRIYDRELPEVKPLTERAMFHARSECDRSCNTSPENIEMHRRYKHQGFVRTLRGRRGRFPGGQRLHKALNMVIQGGAADVMKQKMVEVHRARKKIGFIPRGTNHDEIIGDSLSPETPRLLQEVLNRQSFPQLKVPVLWDVKIGKNWAEC